MLRLRVYGHLASSRSRMQRFKRDRIMCFKTIIGIPTLQPTIS